MKNWMNLYTFLIDHVNPIYCFGNRTNEDINCGRIKVNHNKPDDINMKLKPGDIITVYDFDYIVEQKHLI